MLSPVDAFLLAEKTSASFPMNVANDRACQHDHSVISKSANDARTLADFNLIMYRRVRC